MVGTDFQPSDLAASTRPCPAMISPSCDTSTGFSPSGDWAATSGAVARGFGWGDDPAMMRAVHGEHAVTLAQLIPANGAAQSVTVLDGVFDKGSGALVVTSTHLTDLATGEYLGATRMSVFVQGRGGFGGPREVSGEASTMVPERAPDEVVTFAIAPNQSLLFRLLGDRTRHGTTMQGAQRDGSEKPILFGLGTFGFAGHAQLLACGIRQSWDTVNARHLQSMRLGLTTV
jgi:hypothetical protein